MAIHTIYEPLPKGYAKPVFEAGMQPRFPVSRDGFVGMVHYLRQHLENALWHRRLTSSNALKGYATIDVDDDVKLRAGICKRKKINGVQVYVYRILTTVQIDDLVRDLEGEPWRASPEDVKKWWWS